MTTFCPCGSKQSYQDCCEKIHLSHANASMPEQLMRARFSAHVLGLVDFVVNTYHQSCQAEKHRQAIAESIESEWLALEIINTQIDTAFTEGFVEFKAFYKEQGKVNLLHERSRFVKEHNLWFYIDGEYPQTKALKLSRNDPCPCVAVKNLKNAVAKRQEANG